MLRHKRSVTEARLAELVVLLRDRKSLLVVLQDFPDPDAVAAAAALKVLAHKYGEMPVSIGHGGGVVGRAENRELVRYVGLNLLRLDQVQTAQFDLIAMVDTQPGTGNNSLDPANTPHIVIDHHPMTAATRRTPFHDIRRRYGATSTILYEYLSAAGIAPDVVTATALVYGIRSDTHDLGSDAVEADIRALLSLYPSTNQRMLGRISRAALPEVYFQTLAHALKNARIFGAAVVTTLGETDNPDMIGEVADLLLRREGSEWALCYGLYERKVYLSLRTLDAQVDAGKVMKRIVGRMGSGGGHAAMAGGQVPVAEGTQSEMNRVHRTTVRRFLRMIKADPASGRPLALLR